MMYSAETPLEGDNTSDMVDEQIPSSEDEWLALARDAFTESRDYFDSSIRTQQESALAHFNNKHAPGSKYYSNLYKSRSRGFRPKSRSVVRRNEAAAVKSFFATKNLVHITAEDPSDERQKFSASLIHEVVNQRLQDDVKWLQLVVGAYQDTLVSGVCISYQDWEYTQAKVGEFPIIDQETGLQALDEDGSPSMQPMYKTVFDRPTITLRPVENILFSTAADWIDPINTSPFLIDRMSMYVGDVKQKISDKEWLEVPEGMLQLGSAEDEDSVKRQRDYNREDPHDETYNDNSFNTVWVHRNIIKKDGRDYVYFTLGTYALLSDPVPLVEMYKHLKEGERPYVMGNSTIETHKNYPASLVTLTSGLQQEANDISNQRRDNVSLVLNKRYYVRRGSGVDFRSLTNNVPGSVTVMGDIQNDIRTESPPEVTGSSYQEQDRVNMDYDELSGSFSPSSVGSSKQLGETVGGMDMMHGDANEMMEYQLRVFAETWVSDVIRQIITLEQENETDEYIMALAGKRAQAAEKYGINQITSNMLQGATSVDLNVGFGATSPQKRIEKLTLGLRSVAEFAPDIVQSIDRKEIMTEVMGALGYKGSDRFFPKLNEEQPDPQIQQMQQQIQDLQGQLESQMHMKEADHKRAVEVEQIRMDKEIRIEEMRQQTKQIEIQTGGQLEMTKAQMKQRIDELKEQIKHESNEVKRGQLINARDALLWKMELEGANFKRDSQVAAESPLPNPDDRQGTVIMNDRYQNIPGQEG